MLTKRVDQLTKHRLMGIEEEKIKFISLCVRERSDREVERERDALMVLKGVSNHGRGGDLL